MKQDIICSVGKKLCSKHKNMVKEASHVFAAEMALGIIYNKEIEVP
jgi:hypothetical protein